MSQTVGSMSLEDPRVAAVLGRLHRRRPSERNSEDSPDIAGRGPRLGERRPDAVAPALFRNAYIPVSAEQGRFMYVTACAIGAKRIVEFGTSLESPLCISQPRPGTTAAAWSSAASSSRANGGRPRQSREAGLAEHADIRLGDALEDARRHPVAGGFRSARRLEGTQPADTRSPDSQVEKGSVVLADDIFRFRKAMAPYVELMQSGRNGFRSTSLRIGGGFEYSVYTG